MIRIKKTSHISHAISLFFIFAGIANNAWGATYALPGSNMSIHWIIPFAGMLLSIALCPLILPQIWHHHFGKITLFWIFSATLPLLMFFGIDISIYQISHILLKDYLPFIILLFALFTISGGIRLHGHVHGTPAINTLILLIGTCIASLMGTTGAAMLLIRPMIRANEQRKHIKHIVIFFIFLVANIGGSLTPLGDPPLFVGFLNGVPFWWPLKHIFLPFIVTSSILLVAFYIFDTVMYRKENLNYIAPTKDQKEPIGIDGKINILLLFGVIATILATGLWKTSPTFNILHTSLYLADIIRDISLIILSLLSLLLTTSENRKAHHFTWDPILEVAKLFIGIFITIIPVIAILKTGENGALAPIVHLVSHHGEPVNKAYFWVTGILSSILDNAPTYLVFFNVAGGHAETLIHNLNDTLIAISTGSVFMGAITYVGNAPNFMIKSIAEHRGISMPSFFGYMLWSITCLVPVFILISFIFF